MTVGTKRTQTRRRGRERLKGVIRSWVPVKCEGDPRRRPAQRSTPSRPLSALPVPAAPGLEQPAPDLRVRGAAPVAGGRRHGRGDAARAAGPAVSDRGLGPAAQVRPPLPLPAGAGPEPQAVFPQRWGPLHPHCGPPARQYRALPRHPKVRPLGCHGDVCSSPGPAGAREGMTASSLVGLCRSRVSPASDVCPLTGHPRLYPRGRSGMSPSGRPAAWRPSGTRSSRVSSSTCCVPRPEGPRRGRGPQAGEPPGPGSGQGPGLHRRAWRLLT